MPIGLTAVTPRFTDQHLVHVAKTVGSVFEKEGMWSWDIDFEHYQLDAWSDQFLRMRNADGF